MISSNLSRQFFSAWVSPFARSRRTFKDLSSLSASLVDCLLRRRTLGNAQPFLPAQLGFWFLRKNYHAKKHETQPKHFEEFTTQSKQGVLRDEGHSSRQDSCKKSRLQIPQTTDFLAQLQLLGLPELTHVTT